MVQGAPEGGAGLCGGGAGDAGAVGGGVLPCCEPPSGHGSSTAGLGDQSDGRRCSDGASQQDERAQRGYGLCSKHDSGK